LFTAHSYLDWLRTTPYRGLGLLVAIFGFRYVYGPIESFATNLLIHTAILIARLDRIDSEKTKIRSSKFPRQRRSDVSVWNIPSSLFAGRHLRTAFPR